MSETVQINQLQKIAQVTQDVVNTLRMGFQTLNNTLLRIAQLAVGIAGINQGATWRSSSFFKKLDKTQVVGKGQQLIQSTHQAAQGGSISVKRLAGILKDALSGKMDIFEGITKTSATGGGSDKGGGGKKGIAGLIGGIGKSLLAAFGPMALLMQILSPLINAFLEPMDLLSPLFEQWGMILSTLLYPIILALMPALESLTPVFASLVFLLMPLVDIIVLLINAFAPLLEILVMVITLVFSSGGVVLQMVAGIAASIAFLQVIFTNWRNAAAGFFGNIIADVVGFGQKIKDAFTDAVQNIVDKIKDKFTIFKGGGLDNNTETWW